MANPRRRRIPAGARRTRWTPEQARSVLTELAASGMSVGDFAACQGIDSQRLYRWRQRLGRITTSAMVQGATFAEVTVLEEGNGQVHHSGEERFEIVMRRGHVVRVGPSFDVEALRRLLRVVDEHDRSC